MDTVVHSVLWCWCLGSRKGIRSVKNWVVGCWHGYLSRARCRFAYAQLMPLPLTISCSSKSRLVLPFWCRLTRVVPDKIQDSCKMAVCVCCYKTYKISFQCSLRFFGTMMKYTFCGTHQTCIWSCMLSQNPKSHHWLLEFLFYLNDQKSSACIKSKCFIEQKWLYCSVVHIFCIFHNMSVLTHSLQCFDAVGWVAGRIPSLSNLNGGMLA